MFIVVHDSFNHKTQSGFTDFYLSNKYNIGKMTLNRAYPHIGS